MGSQWRPENAAPEPRRFSLWKRLITIALLVPALGYVGYLAIVLGPDLANLEWEDLVRGYHRTLWPADVRGPLLRTSQGDADRLYLLTTQQERIVPLRLGRVSSVRARQMLHVDLWAFDSATAQPAWRRRLRTFEDGGALTFEILGADAETLWLLVREPLAVSLRDGAILADGARLEALNPPLVGKRVDDRGFVAFGGQGLQLTLSDSTQWIVDGSNLSAQTRASAPKDRERVVKPAYESPYTAYFQMRGVPIGSMWLGVLTDQEAATLQAAPVVPGAKPGDRPGVMADFLASQHVPGDLGLNVLPAPYRLWSAKIEKVSAAPRDWPKELPDNWGTRDQFADYKPLPEAPPFLQAGLLGDGRSDYPFWFRQPDSVLVLHHDKVGSAGRLRLARVSGPAGHVVYDAPLLVADVHASTFAESSVALFGGVPNAAYDAHSETSSEQHQVVVSLNVANGNVATYDLTAESLADTTPATGSTATADGL